MRVIPVPADKVDAVWPEVFGWAARACQYSKGRETAGSLYTKVKEGNGYILCTLEHDGVRRGIVVFERAGEWLHAVTLAGKDLIAHMPELVWHWADIAQHIGCNGLSLNGRKGWERVFTPFGFVRNGEDLEVHLNGRE